MAVARVISSFDELHVGTSRNSSGLTYGRLFHVSHANGCEGPVPPMSKGDADVKAPVRCTLRRAADLVQVAQAVLQTVVEKETREHRGVGGKVGLRLGDRLLLPEVCIEVVGVGRIVPLAAACRLWKWSRRFFV